MKNNLDFTDVASLSATSYVQGSGIASGETYQFRVQARNEVGFSGYSSILEIIAGTIPSTLEAPTTEIDSSG